MEQIAFTLLSLVFWHSHVTLTYARVCGRSKHLLKLSGLKEPRFIFYAHYMFTTGRLDKALSEGSAHCSLSGTWTVAAALLNVDFILALNPSVDLFSSLSKFCAKSNNFLLFLCHSLLICLHSCPSWALFNSREGLQPSITSTQQFFSQNWFQALVTSGERSSCPVPKHFMDNM